MARIPLLTLAVWALMALSLGGALPIPALAATITVNTSTDELNADGDCSLREAIRAANLNSAVDSCVAGSGADTITIPSGIYVLTIAGTGEDASATGDLDITESLTLNGAGSTVIDGNGAILNDRVIHVTGASSVNLSGVVVRKGNPFNLGGGIWNAAGNLTINNSTVSDNSAGTAGGGIFSGGSLIVSGSTVHANNAFGTGGGISSSGSMTLANSTVAGNFGVGGGLYNSGTMTVATSTVSGNASFDASEGGGVRNEGTLTVTNSTVSGNSATNSFGGGLSNFSGSVTLTNSTVNGNSAFSGGGLYNFSGTVQASNIIVANSLSGGSCGGVAVTSNGYNLSSDGTCAFNRLSDINNTNPLLGSLAFNGGPTRTHALLLGSPALDNGSTTCPPAADQRGVTRPQGPRCEIGAFEATDADGDAIPDAFDDNDDNDGLIDANDPCPLVSEDYDGFLDPDGCPDPDNDLDGVCDTGQASASCSGSDNGKLCFDPAGTLSCQLAPVTDCRNVAEDIDAFKDTDGCPEPDNDNDSFPDATDTCPGTDSQAGADGMLGSPQDLNHNGIRDGAEAIFTTDDVPTYAFEDRDGVLDTDGCHDSPGEDFDGDGYTDDNEALKIGTNAGYSCGNTGWPSDLLSTGLSANKLDVQDILSFVAPTRKLDSSPTGATASRFNARWDLAPGANFPFSNHINILDITTLLQGPPGSPAFPPMFQGPRAFGRTCPLVAQ